MSPTLGTAEHLKPLSFISAEVQIHFPSHLFEGAPYGLTSISHFI